MRNPNAVISDPNTFVTCPGSRYHVVYAPKISSDGSLRLVKSDTIDIKQYINSFREVTDISYMLNRLHLGDSSVLNRNVGSFGDFTEAPKTMAETLQLAIDAEKAFLGLPLHIRQQFDNDFRKWFSSAGSPVWLEKMKAFVSSDPDLEVKPVESKSKESEVPNSES